MLPNRVDGTADDILPLNKPRLKAVTSETGAQTIVTYLDADCTAAPSPSWTRTPGAATPCTGRPTARRTPARLVPEVPGRLRVHH
ncbi:hypothetical protein ACFQ3Z_45010 [Streptomyces nogalater]